MLAHQIYEDAQQYESLCDLYKHETQSFDAVLGRYEYLFDWYPLKLKELACLPSGLAFDLRQHNEDAVSAKLVHLPGSGKLAFETSRGILQEGLSEQQWFIRLGLLHKIESKSTA